MTLYFLYSTTCPSCKIGGEDLTSVQVSRFDFVPIRVIESMAQDQVVAGFRPRVTPAYAFVHGGQVIAKHEGLLRVAQLNKFIDNALAISRGEVAHGVKRRKAGEAKEQQAPAREQQASNQSQRRINPSREAHNKE